MWYFTRRVIALCDSDAFYASCERVRLNVDPEQPLVVQQWTNLIAVNYPARKFGITRHESIIEARKKCPDLMAVHVATYKEGDSEPQYWEDPSPTTHKVSLDHYRRESSRVFQLFQDMMPAGGEIEKASIDEVFIDYTIPVRVLMVERYPELRVPDGPFDLDTPLPSPPTRIDWARLDTHVIPVTKELSADKAEVPRPRTPSITLEPTPDIIDNVLSSGSLTHSSLDPLSTELPEVGSDAPLTWHDVALSIAAELMRDIRQVIFEKLGYTLSAGIARNKMLAKIRFLGGKLGDAMATQFGATTVSELREIELGAHLGPSLAYQPTYTYQPTGTIRGYAAKVWRRVYLGLECSTFKERTALKSMMASKNVRPAITTAEQARHWLAVLSAELTVRLTDARKVNATVWPRTLVLHIRQGTNAPRSKQVAFPFTRSFTTATILAPAEKLWRMLLPGTGDLSVGVINVALGFAGLDALEVGQKGIEGFFSAKGPNSSAKKTSFSINKPTTTKPESLASDNKARRTASPGPKDGRHQGREQLGKLKRDFFNGVGSNKRKVEVHEVLDDSSSDIVEISPPPAAKRVNSGSGGESGTRNSTPTPFSRNDKRGPSSNNKDKAKSKKADKAISNGTANISTFFAPRSEGINAKVKRKK
ncbi:DNA polymerase [Rhizoctonia solani]|uniref:DNA polymerase eta n=1 Tax=Rhizoctonia solani TaxID=456999 RepID=A0A8H7LD47_9AGAM|nr:DNA polymerase [Rhizoctonia solani]